MTTKQQIEKQNQFITLQKNGSLLEDAIMDSLGKHWLKHWGFPNFGPSCGAQDML